MKLSVCEHLTSRVRSHPSVQFGFLIIPLKPAQVKVTLCGGKQCGGWWRQETLTIFIGKSGGNVRNVLSIGDRAGC